MLALCLALSSSAAVWAGDELQSPRLRLLEEALQRDTSATGAFWREIEEQGAPLIEPIEGEEGSYSVTFLWRHDKSQSQGDNVLVLGMGTSSDFTEERMHRLGSSDVLYRSYRRSRGFRGSYQLSPNDPLTLPDLSDPGWWPQRLQNFQADPLNHHTFGPRHSFFELPGAPTQPWIEPRPENPAGTVVEHESFASEILGNERPISVYLPPGYAEGAGPYPLFVVFDRGAYLNQVPTPTILDNLIAAGEIPPLVAVFVGNAPGARNVELPCNPEFAEFLATELFPFVRARYRLTTDPRLSVVGGSSFGGLASTYFALKHPELVGNVLSQSGSYWWSEGWDFRNPDPSVEGEWLAREFARVETKPVRFYMDVGIYEAGNPSMAVVNRHLRNVLLAKGYDVVKYVEFVGGHDYVVWRGTLADGLIALLGHLTAASSEASGSPGG